MNSRGEGEGGGREERERCLRSLFTQLHFNFLFNLVPINFAELISAKQAWQQLRGWVACLLFFFSFKVARSLCLEHEIVANIKIHLVLFGMHAVCR